MIRLPPWAALLAAPGALGAATAFSSLDLGGSPTPIGAGARALGMGGAFTAIADDATANTWNPAGMTQLEQPEMALSGGYHLRHDRSASGTATHDQFAADHVGVVVPFHLGVQQTLGLAWQRQLDFTKAQSFASEEVVDLGFGDTQTESSAAAITQQGSFATIALSYAAEVVPGLSFGATAQAWGDRWTAASEYESRAWLASDSVFATGGTPAGGTRGTSTSTADVEVERGLSAVLGGHWIVNEHLTLGVAAKPRFTLDLEHALRQRQVVVDAASGAVVADDVAVVRSSSRLSMPLSATLGAALRLGDLRTVAVDVTWTRWRGFASEADGTTSSPVNKHVAPSDYRDGWAVRLGYEHIVPLSRVVLVPRCGLLWEEVPGVTAAPDLTRVEEVSARFDRYVGATIGLSAFRTRIVYDIAAQARHARDVVDDGTPPDESADVWTLVVRGAVAFLF
ncbi:MAG TPA: outer membrane protein transport protein [Planctomycetota bacterium]|nr:outer membrane protein transport protein [Planctomycetota bacterium]